MIRPFVNTDVPALANVWRENARRLDFDPPPVDPAMIARALVARIGFTRDDLLVLSSDDSRDNTGETAPLTIRVAV